MRILLSLIVLVLTFLVGQQTATACSCAQRDVWLSEVIENNDYIFIGTPTALTKDGLPVGIEEAWSHNNITVTFNIETWLKSDTGLPKVNIGANFDSAACGMPHFVGARELVFANKNADGTKIHAAGLCSPSLAFSDRDVVKFFQTGKDRFSEGSGFGRRQNENPYRGSLFF